ncbi:MAG: formate dehydrogenase accessory protein FdhE, partial [Actinomycetota bacterium]|nr:formate dehydrogenase accessory protein FdhE [Actinomycetota bacterium]
CPVCGGQPQASVIAEESGEFMAGSPRSLVCGRCASWWPFSRATCAGCGEDDSRSIESFLVEEQRWVRVDTCATCRAYIKTFDFRERGAVDVVPLVDDVASLTLDVWVQGRGFTRSALSFAGV